jgi:dTDP-4-dehydrorhamnose reductase
VILVFGGNGQLGRELARAACSRAIPLRALSHAEADIVDSAAVAAALARWKPQLVVNAAAYTKVDLAEANVEEARRGNETGPAVLAGACATAGVPMIHVSTDYVFDGGKQGAYLETDPVRPLNVYGRTKAAGEEAVRRALDRHIILRTAWVYSEFGDNFVKTILRLAATRDELRVVADQHGSPTSACDIADAILHIAPSLLSDPGRSGTYHFTAAGLTTWCGFASRIVAAAAPISGRHPRVTPIRTSEYPKPAKRPANSHLDCRLFVQTFGLSPRPWPEAVEATTKTLLASSQTAESHVA